MNKFFTNLFDRVIAPAQKGLAVLTLCPVIIAMTACQPSAVNLSKNPFCQHPQNTNEYCSFALGDNQFWLSSSDPAMPIERGVTIDLVSDQAIQNVVGEIRGVSMYMGRLPLVWQQLDERHWQAEVMLGACTDPKMVWRMLLTLETGDTGATRTYAQEVVFQSYIP